MWTGNSRNLALVLAVLILILMINNAILFHVIKSKGNENSEKPQSIKRNENNQIIFESDNEKIKQNAVYYFVLFGVLIITLLLFDKIIKKWKRK
jgi:uncharacterized membrane protein